MNQEFDLDFKIRVQNAARISDIADRNFSAEQQIALENARLAQTVDLENLSNSQALVIANATALANLDVTSLTNMQKANSENAKNFLQIDMQNKDHNQQAGIIQYEKLAEAVLSDVAMQNAASKINTTEENQMNQYHSGLVAGIGTTNVNLANAQSRDNAGEYNVQSRHNSDTIVGVQKFNSTQGLQIEQSNAVWRRDMATLNTAAINFENQTNAKAVLGISEQMMDWLWQEMRDVMEMSWQSGESEQDRIHALQITAINAENNQLAMQYQADRENSAGIGGWLGELFAPFAAKAVDSLIGAF
jgi:hypothetical protein